MSAADRLRQKMQRTKDGWNADDLRKLYEGFGFECREGGKHRICIHAAFRDIRTTIIRDGKVPAGYIQKALKHLDEVENRERLAP